MSAWVDASDLAVAALLLSIERLCYLWAWYRTDSFREFCGIPLIARLGEPVVVLERLFYLFKLIQVGVFVGWCVEYGDGSFWPEDRALPPILVGVGALLLGQVLNLSVFVRLGRNGVFYGNRFGHPLPRITGFPFSLLRHPQYTGAALSVWGFFMLTRFPNEDWLILPVVQTLYYAVGARLES